MKFISLVWLVCSFSAFPLLAQTEAPSTEQMIEQLKAPLTRGGLRNFAVEAAVPVPEKKVLELNGTSNDPGQIQDQEPSTAAASIQVVRPSLSLLIQFDFNSSRVRLESQQVLANLAQALQSTDLRDSRFAVEGHTDAKGGVAFNQKLSLQRAQAVRDYLKVKGVEERRLVAVGKGSSELVNPTDPFAAENRRVRIVNQD